MKQEIKLNISGNGWTSDELVSFTETIKGDELRSLPSKCERKGLRLSGFSKIQFRKLWDYHQATKKKLPIEVLVGKRRGYVAISFVFDC